MNSRGFTLIELIACLILISIFAALAVPRFVNLQPNAEKKLLQMVLAEMNSQEILAWNNCRLETTDQCIEYERPIFDNLQGVKLVGTEVQFVGGGHYPVYDAQLSDGYWKWYSGTAQDAIDPIDPGPNTCKVKHCGKKKHWDPDTCQCVKD